MRKILSCLSLSVSILCLGQNQSSLNYFYNLSYSNPAFSKENPVQIDINTVSYYNALPLGIYSISSNIQYISTHKIGASFSYGSLLLGKSSKQNTGQVFLNYDLELNFQSKLNLGVGIKSMSNSIDETRLSTGLDNVSFEYSYGNEITKTNNLLLPIGVEVRTKKFKSGAYFSKGIGVNNQFGFYAKTETFEFQIKQVKLKNYTGISFYQEFLNPQIAFSNTSDLDNYSLDIFAKYNLSKELSNLLALGAGIHYHWKTYDLNYQFAVNNQNLGLSHQISLQFFY